MIGWLKNLFFIVCILVIFVAGGTLWLVNLPNKATTSTTLIIEKGWGSHQVAQQLYKAGVISHPLLFKILARVHKTDKELQAGEYVFEPHISMSEVLNILKRGEVRYHSITLPEGLTTAKILQIIKNESNLSGEITIKVNEGELLPETYSYVMGEQRDNLINRARKAMQDALQEAWQQNKSNVIHNPKELLILASIIEKETAVAKERPDIASVFINRLKIGMKLQTDPSVIYAITHGKKDLGRKLYKKDLSIDSPFNTYKYYGLPPEPICNPGKDALLAAANPSQSDYLYFVATGKGGHRFARSLKEHNQNVNLYRQHLKQK